MQVVLGSIVAVLGTLLGAGLTGVLQRSTAGRANAETRQEKRREEFARAVATFSSAAMLLRRAEYDRARKRLEQVEGIERDEARQETYKLRTEARIAYYSVRLLADPESDQELLQEAKVAMSKARAPGEAESLDELERTSDVTAKAIDKVVDAANARLRTWPPYGR